MSQREIIDNANPKLVWHMKAFRRQAREPSDLEQSGRRQYQPPDLLEFPIPQLERLKHSANIQLFSVVPEEYGVADCRNRNRTTDSLPTRGISLHVNKDRAQNLKQRRTNICPIGRRVNARSDAQLRDVQVLAESRWSKRSQRMDLVGPGSRPCPKHFLKEPS